VHYGLRILPGLPSARLGLALFPAGDGSSEALGMGMKLPANFPALPPSFRQPLFQFPDVAKTVPGAQVRLRPPRTPLSPKTFFFLLSPN